MRSARVSPRADRPYGEAVVSSLPAKFTPAKLVAAMCRGHYRSVRRGRSRSAWRRLPSVLTCRRSLQSGSSYFFQSRTYLPLMPTAIDMSGGSSSLQSLALQDLFGLGDVQSPLPAPLAVLIQHTLLDDFFAVCLIASALIFYEEDHQLHLEPNLLHVYSHPPEDRFTRERTASPRSRQSRPPWLDSSPRGRISRGCPPSNTSAPWNRPR